MLRFILVTTLIISSLGIPDNDNYIIFNEDIGGYPVVNSEGFAFFISTSVAKVDLNTKSVEKKIEIYNDATHDYKPNTSKGVLSTDESILLAYSDSSAGGPN